MIDFNGMSTSQGLFYALTKYNLLTVVWLWYYVHIWTNALGNGKVGEPNRGRP